jgi:wyosine [tRNA(Phe)-imidazoG37] synthetase (radical SAM superfamily)
LAPTTDEQLFIKVRILPEVKSHENRQEAEIMKAFGPVPSRRLGRSLGINNIPPKVCTYSCIYCQLGRTIKLTNKRDAFYPPEEILQDVREKIEKSNCFSRWSTEERDSI